MAREFIVFLLVKTIWLGAHFNDADGSRIDPPQVRVAYSVEVSLEACRTDGLNWYQHAIGQAAAGKADDLELNALTYDCVVQAVGGTGA